MTAGPQTDPWTVLRLLQWTTDFFKRKKFDSPRLDAEVLLATALGCRRIELYTAFDKQPDDANREAFRELVRRRGEGTPVAYLVGHKEFYSLDFFVNESVLIPRPETEHLVIEVLDLLKKQTPANPTPRILDIGTGSGAIAVSLAKHLPQAQVVAVDISPDALSVAKRNVEKHQLQQNIELLQSDLFNGLTGRSEKFDIIASNPPYISEAEFKTLSPEVSKFEPRGALVGGVQGTEIIERILDEAPKYLVPGGSVVIELSPMIADQVQQLVAARPAYGTPRFIKDLAQHRRILSVRAQT